MAPSGQLPGRACPSRVQAAPAQGPLDAGLQPTSLAESDPRKEQLLVRNRGCGVSQDLN